MEIHILKSRILPDERETHICFDPDTKLWTMDSTIPRHFNKAIKVGWKPVREYHYEDGQIAAMVLAAPERGLTIKSPKKRELTDEHKAKLLSSKINDLECIFEDND